MKIEKYTFGIGDRFAHQGQAQLRAIQEAQEMGMEVHPVWNKSHREHLIIGSKPEEVRKEADLAVSTLGWKGAYYVDADHIGFETVEAFIPASNFFTLDVADFIGKEVEEDALHGFLKNMRPFLGSLAIPGIALPLELSEEKVLGTARKFLLSMQEAGRIYRHLKDKKGETNFVTEVSVDETNTPQNPLELFLILAMIAFEGVPIQTIAPKFTGRFNKGIDYAGDLLQFEKEFDQDLSVIAFGAREFGLPQSLKLSVHSGSDKFSLYPIINRLIKKHDAGLHVKTAGTTWLEEVIGLAESGGEGLALVKEIYASAHEQFAEMAALYLAVIDIDAKKLPEPGSVRGWSSTQFAAALRHEESAQSYNPHFRQLLHISYKVAAKMGERFTVALKRNEQIVGENVRKNLLDRHLGPLFA